MSNNQKEYNPRAAEDRMFLASAIIAELAGLGFDFLDGDPNESHSYVTKELVMWKELKPGVGVTVYTTIVKSKHLGLEVRADGADSLKVVLSTSDRRGLGRSARVHRTRS